MTGAKRPAEGVVTARSEVVGSLLRPPELVQARKALEGGQLSPVDFKRIEDRAVDGAVELQDGAGIEVITDGEQRRYAFYGHLVEALDGFDKQGGWAIPFRDETGEEDERRDHPPPPLAERRMRDAQEQDEARDERRDPERDVQAERDAAEENVAEDPLEEGRAKEGQPEPRAAAHALPMQAAAYWERVKAPLAVPPSGRAVSARPSELTGRNDGVIKLTLLCHRSRCRHQDVRSPHVRLN